MIKSLDNKKKLNLSKRERKNDVNAKMPISHPRDSGELFKKPISYKHRYSF